MSDDREEVQRRAGAGLLAAIDAKRGRIAAPAAPDPPAADPPAADRLRAAGEGLLAAIDRKRGIQPPAPEVEQDEPESDDDALLRRGLELAAEEKRRRERTPWKTGTQVRGDA